uniref:Adenylate isopentenyltransferase n=1 Tax=Kalanchoe fedtschenkoi TaxID=63787 RepID=A0A7N0UF66_KALFE
MAPPAPPQISTRAHRDVKIVVLMGATGTGKSRLSIDLATRYFPSSEIINCDKIQLYKGLDITTNKIPPHERRGVVHHLLGEFEAELSAAEYRSLASAVITDVVSRRKVPLLVGGSNSFIHALLAERFDPHYDPFPGSGSGSISSSLRYTCCFLWVDVSVPVLNEYLLKRVDDMLKSGMFEELESYFTSPASLSAAGINRAIGVPEFEPYFRKYPRTIEDDDDAAGERIECCARAVKAIKENTCQLAKRQMGKILRLREAGWDLKRLDATETFRAVMAEETAADGAWERDVVEPSVKIVKRFLADE